MYTSRTHTRKRTRCRLDTITSAHVLPSKHIDTFHSVKRVVGMSK